MSQHLRDRAFGLLSSICAGGDIAPDALRIASHTLVNLADDNGAESLSFVKDALPWLAAMLELDQGDTASDVATRLAARGGLRALDDRFVACRLDATRHSATSSVVDDAGPRWQNALEELASLDRALVELSLRSDREIRRTLISDIRLLAAAVEFVEESAQSTPVIGRLVELFPEWKTGSRSRALSILQGLETRWDGGPLLKQAQGLSDRSRRFEISSTDHLSQNGYLVAVRAAIAFGPPRPGQSEALEERIASFDVFRQDPGLASLTLALSRVRGRTLNVIRGAAPLASLGEWVTFMRGPCAELAEARGIGLREASSFAHYCYHLMNFCDLMATEPDATNDLVRRGVMDVEDELKEFAIVGQVQGLSDVQANLERYDMLRWKSVSPVDRVADRLARLQGAWRAGLEPAPLGAPARVLSATRAALTRELETLDNSAPGAVPHLLQLLQPCRILNAHLVQDLAPPTLVSLLALALSAIRDAPGIDVTCGFALDLAPLQAWLSDPRRGELFDRLVLSSDLEERLLGGEEQGDRGIVIQTLDNQLARLSISTSDEIEALLTVLSTSTLEPFAHQALEDRLNTLLTGARSGWNTTSLGEESRVAR